MGFTPKISSCSTSYNAGLQPAFPFYSIPRALALGFYSPRLQREELANLSRLQIEEVANLSRLQREEGLCY